MIIELLHNPAIQGLLALMIPVIGVLIYVLPRLDDK